MEVSIIIRTKNEGKDLQRVLDKIFKQNFKDYEIILIDSGSTDNTLKIAKRNKLKILNMKSEDFTFGRAINLGCQHAKGRYIVLVSGHAIPKNNSWLQELVTPLKNKEIVGSYSRQLPAKNAYNFIIRDMSKTFPNKQENKLIMFSNAASALKKSAWKKIKIDEKLLGSEDIDWAKKWLNKGKKVEYCPKSEIHHSHNETYEQIKHRSYREALSNLNINEVRLSMISEIIVVLANIKNFLKDCAYFLLLKDDFNQFKKAILFRIASVVGFHKAYAGKKQR
ncbi:glycosyltransferase family 2 protein [Nanoarchaeota archaeon]